MLQRIPALPIGSEITQSESHPSWGRHLRNRESLQGDVGGSFYNKKSGVRLVNADAQKLDGLQLDNSFFPPRRTVGIYHGPVMAEHPGGISLPTLNEDSFATLSAKGTTAIARCKPTNNVADLSNFLAELYRDGLPKLFGATLWKERTFAARNAGEEYLNEEFGWKPMVSDVQDIFHAVTHAHDVLNHYEQNSGHVVRRKYAFPVEESTSSPVLVSNTRSPIILTGTQGLYFDTGKSQNGKLWVTTKTIKRTWFSGAFTYHLPSGYRSRNAMIRYGTQARTLLGLRLTPEVIWNAAPWTWAIDWFSNAGDVVSNLSDWATDGLVLKYGYIMQQCISENTYFMEGYGRLRSTNVHVSPVVAYQESKRREVATPFGFELSWNGLSPRQLAISAALGLTRR
jgi:hypothetical protein